MTATKKFDLEAERFCFAWRGNRIAFLVAIFLLIGGLVGGCKASVEPSAIEEDRSTKVPTSTMIPAQTPKPTPIILSTPNLLPSFLVEVRPFPSSVISQEDYQTKLIPEFTQEGPPPPSVEFTGLRSSICVYLNVEPLVESGDILFFDKQVLSRIEVMVDDMILTQRDDTEYLSVIEPGPTCKCFYNCEDSSSGGARWPYDAIPENIGCWFEPGFWSCYPADLEVGVHTASFRFSKTSGEVEEFSWDFAITE